MNRLAADLQEIASNTDGLWDELRGQNLFITGGTGFFGCWLVESFCFLNRLLALNAHATILTRNPGRFAEKCPHLASDAAITLQHGDVRSFEFPAGEYGYVIHAATEASAKQAADSPLEMFSTIVAGTEHTLEFAVTHGTRKFLLTSSGAVYGRQPAEITHVPETYGGAPDPLHAASVYAEGKRSAELLCALFSKQSSVECKIARCWAFCGPHLPLHEHFAIGNFIGNVLAGNCIEIAGDGTPRRSYLYAADLATWLWTILFRAPELVAINVGSSQDVSILELAETVARTLSPQTKIRIATAATPGAIPPRYVPSVDRARELLGLRQTVGLEECIRRTAQWHAKEPGRRNVRGVIRSS
jgi:nucleoside-diphosphate-sugar epimerase